MLPGPRQDAPVVKIDRPASLVPGPSTLQSDDHVGVAAPSLRNFLQASDVLGIIAGGHPAETPMRASEEPIGAQEEQRLARVGVNFGAMGAATPCRRSALDCPASLAALHWTMPKRCSCGRGYCSASSSCLPLVGYMDNGRDRGELLERPACLKIVATQPRWTRG
ncbi:MAG: hypothetical protein JWN10_2433 [Solirubrobacterales bacterium]|nr:hypothetical protein [Solirubrobacterales bacterium]